MKKKITITLLAGLLTLSLSSCGGKSGAAPAANTSGSTANTTDSTNTANAANPASDTADPAKAADPAKESDAAAPADENTTADAAAPTANTANSADPTADTANATDPTNTANAANPASDTPDASSSQGSASKSDIPSFTFNTVTIDGDSVDNSIFKDSRVTMINFWEPWCGPCVAEMPDLEKLYENYKDKGFSIVGIYTTTDMEQEARQILSECGTTYPILVASETMFPFMTGYVPTTIFVDSEGKLISNEPVVGANTYNDWVRMIENILK